MVRSIHLGGQRTRKDLADRLELNRSTIKAVVDELVGDGLAIENPDSSGGNAGRPSLVVAPVPSSVWVVAVDAAIDWLTVAAVGLGGSVLAEVRLEPPAGEFDPQVLVRLLGDAVTSIGARFDRPPSAVGVAVPGLVRSSDNLVRSAPNLGWVDVPLGDMLAAETGSDVFVGNESNLGALAEHVRGAARDVDDVVYLMADVGVGGGVISSGVTVVGAGGYAVELGHMGINGRRRCRCGSLGCWETEVGRFAMQRAVGLPEHATIDELCDRLQSCTPGDPVLDSYAEWLALGLRNVVAMFDPRVVVFGGLFADLLPAVQDRLVASLAESLVVRQFGVQLRPAALGSRASLVGAAEVAFATVLDRV
ncbi:sugar kinase [Rhodococcoides trifolii]|uniref:Sugar kinase n=1 Tax=Rhodococcoides trifolii TaxID=908250 RepID=A0A917CQP3_9NOCA|nr:sugar kinase [Rhodococcus trifolii]